MSLLTRADPWGDDFKLLGVNFDTELAMTEAISDMVDQAGWKMRAHTDAD